MCASFLLLLPVLCSLSIVGSHFGYRHGYMVLLKAARNNEVVDFPKH